MALDLDKMLRAVDTGLAVQELELAEARSRQYMAVARKTATGSGDMNETFGLDRRYRLVFVRCHFAGGTGTTSFSISVDSGAGSAHDTHLFTVMQAGTGNDVHLRIGGGDAGEPAAWTFQGDDDLRIEWTNPDSGNMTWGLEVGLALAS